MEPRPLIFDLDPTTLGDLLANQGMPRYRAQQVLHWVYGRGLNDPSAMTNIDRPGRECLAKVLRFSSGQTVRHQVASDGVQKLLVQWDADEGPGPALGEPDADAAGQTECVLIPAGARRTACVSSQVGCAVGCRFCASGLGGLGGNLTAGRIVEQVWLLGTLPEGGRISHVVFMGMGEPLTNFEQVIKAVRILMSDWGPGISGRRITISTVGLPAQIRRLADLQLPVTLALSLHAPNDQVRRTLIPWAQSVTVAQLIEAGRYYFKRTGREVTLEYTLLRGINDRPEHAQELAQVARSLRSNVNLIRYNEVGGLEFRRPRDRDVHVFEEILREAGVNTHIRASRGRDIDAACGQLRREVHGQRSGDRDTTPVW